MARDIDDLQANAAQFWPTSLTNRHQPASIIPKLIESQEKFIGILYVADSSPTAWKNVLLVTDRMPANLFLKHLSVLSDVGGERLQRYRANVRRLFPKAAMEFRWKDATHKYFFRSIETFKTWTNRNLALDGPGLARDADLSPAIEDVAMLLIHGGTAIGPGIPDEITEKCVIGSLIGDKHALNNFVRQRYIHVSRITGGAKANALGQLCQSYVRERLQNALPDWDFSRHTIPGISHNDRRTDMSFDLIARSPRGRCCAIEISFQVTTNSTIERKAGQAGDRQRLLHKKGHKIAYVIDGAGNFERRSALATICQYSDCTVTYKDVELDALARFLRSLK